MKLTLLLLLLLSGFTYAQDTTDIYVINNTNRFVAIDHEGNTSYAIVYRDLRSIKEMHTIHFENKANAHVFFEHCMIALEQDKIVENKRYSINRNALSKNVIRVEDEDEGYFMLKYSTVERMRTAFERQ